MLPRGRGGGGARKAKSSPGILQKLSLNEMKIAIITIALLETLSLAKGLQPVDVKVTFDESFYGFNVSLSGVEWLRSGPIGIRDAGQWWASNNKDKYLAKVAQHFDRNGEDIFGAFDSTEYVYKKDLSQELARKYIHSKVHDC